MFYRILPILSRVFGAWTFDLIARGIAAGYFFFAPRRARTSVRFYGALFPQRSRLYHCRCAWKQFQNFTSVYLDRHLLASGDIRFSYEGWEHIENALDRKTGGIILMLIVENHTRRAKGPSRPTIQYSAEGIMRDHPHEDNHGAGRSSAVSFGPAWGGCWSRLAPGSVPRGGHCVFCTPLCAETQQGLSFPGAHAVPVCR